MDGLEELLSCNRDMRRCYWNKTSTMTREKRIMMLEFLSKLALSGVVKAFNSRDSARMQERVVC